MSVQYSCVDTATPPHHAPRPSPRLMGAGRRLRSVIRGLSSRSRHRVFAAQRSSRNGDRFRVIRAITGTGACRYIPVELPVPAAGTLLSKASQAQALAHAS